VVVAHAQPFENGLPIRLSDLLYGWRNGSGKIKIIGHQFTGQVRAPFRENQKVASCIFWSQLVLQSFRDAASASFKIVIRATCCRFGNRTAGIAMTIFVECDHLKLVDMATLFADAPLPTQDRPSCFEF
jgi:hypothetical protein